MQIELDISEQKTWRASHAVVIYRDQGNETFATIHEIQGGDTKTAPRLMPGQPLTTSFLRTLAEGLGKNLKPELLAENVLCRTPDRIVWWTPPRSRVMFFRADDAKDLNGGIYPQPALLWKIAGRGLYVRALKKAERPREETPVFTAPYWNVDPRDGHVCHGSMRVPDRVTSATLTGWEDGFFQSEFTHHYGAGRLTTYKAGFPALWRAIRGRKTGFPSQHLVPSKQSLRAFLEDPK